MTASAWFVVGVMLAAVLLIAPEAVMIVHTFEHLHTVLSGR